MLKANLAYPSLLGSPEKEAFKKRAKLQQENSEETDENEAEEVRDCPVPSPLHASPPTPMSLPSGGTPTTTLAGWGRGLGLPPVELVPELPCMADWLPW